MSAQLHIDLAGLQALSHRLNQLAITGRDGLLEIVGAELESQTRRRISDEKSAPDGTPWPELNSRYEAQKAQRSSGGLLEFDGNLVDSIRYEVSGDEVTVGTDLVYAAPHQFGSFKQGIEPREFLGLSPDNEQELALEVDAYLDSLIGAAA